MANKKGFTLIEVVVVLVILSLIAALTYPSLASYIQDSQHDAYINEAKKITKSADLLAKKLASKNLLDKTKFSVSYNLKIISDAGFDDTYECKLQNIKFENDSSNIKYYEYKTSDGKKWVIYELKDNKPTYTIVDKVDESGLETRLTEVLAWEKEKYDGGAWNPTKYIDKYIQVHDCKLTPEQKKVIFGDLETDKEDMYLWPSSVIINGEMQNIQMVTWLPSFGYGGASGANRYQIYAFIIEGQFYISDQRDGDGKVKQSYKLLTSAATPKDPSIKVGLIMDVVGKANQGFSSVDQFADFISNSPGGFTLAN